MEMVKLRLEQEALVVVPQFSPHHAPRLSGGFNSVLQSWHSGSPLRFEHLWAGRPLAQSELPAFWEPAPQGNLDAQLHGVVVERVGVWVHLLPIF